MRPNWFIGWPVPPPPGLAAALAAAPVGVRVFHPADLHVTLAFLGPVDEEAAQAAFRLAERWHGPPVTARLGAVVPMGPPARPSALSALIEGDDGALSRAMSALARPMCRAADARRPKHPPKPHVTVARPMRRATETQRADALAWAASLRLPSDPVLLPSLALYTWNRDRRSQLFRVVERHVVLDRRRPCTEDPSP